MGKKKANSRAKRKENNQKLVNKNTNSSNTKKTETKQNNTEKKSVSSGYQPQPAPKLTVYTIVAMLASLVSAGATVFSMIIFARPVNYAAEDFFGDSIESLYYDMITQLIEEEGYDRLFVGLNIGLSAALVIAAILAIITVTRSVNPENKPLIVTNIVAFMLSGVAIALYFVATHYINDRFEQLGVLHTARFGIYSCFMIVLIVNAVMLLANIFATVLGRMRWNRDGKAF